MTNGLPCTFRNIIIIIYSFYPTIMLEWTLFVATAAVLPWSLSAGWVVSRDGKVYVLCYPLNDFCTFQIISIELTLFSVAQRPSFLSATKPIFVELYYYYYLIQLCTATLSLTLTQLLLKALDAGPTILLWSTLNHEQHDPHNARQKSKCRTQRRTECE